MKDGKMLAKVMVDFANQLSPDEHKIFVKEMLKAHLTLQQNFTKICMMWFKELADSKFIDDRNAGSAKLAQEITKQFGDTYLPFV